MKIGDGFIALACLVWLSSTIGPWWLGTAIFAVAWALNVWRRHTETTRANALFEKLKGGA